MLNAGFGVQQLNQAWATPARLSKGQQGLFDTLGESLNPTPEIDIQDPSTLRQAAQHSIQKGDTVKGSQLMQQAQQIEQRQTKAANENIKRAYAQMEAKGPEALAKFESAMAQAGKTDLLADVKRQRMQDKTLEMRFGSAQDAEAVKELTNAYFGSTTPQGKEEALNQLREQGYGEAATMIERQESQFAMEQTEQQFNQEALLTKQAEQAIDQAPIYTDEKNHKAWLSTIPENMRPYAELRRAEYLSTMRDYQEQETTAKVGRLAESLVKDAGLSSEEYTSLITGLGPLKANERVMTLHARNKGSSTAKEDKPVPPSYVTNAGKYVEEYMKDADDAELYEGYEQRLAQRTAEIADKEGLASLSTAFDMAKTELAKEIQEENTNELAGTRRRRTRANRQSQRLTEARPTGVQREDLVSDLTDEELDAAIANVMGRRK